MHHHISQFGLHLTMGDDFYEYVMITDGLPGKSPTYPDFCPDCSDLLPGKAFWIMGSDRSDRIAHVQACGSTTSALKVFMITLRRSEITSRPLISRQGPALRVPVTHGSARGITGLVQRPQPLEHSRSDASPKTPPALCEHEAPRALTDGMAPGTVRISEGGRA